MKQRLIASSIVVLLFALGLWGQFVLAPENLTERLPTSLYQLLMLFFLSGEWTLGLDPLPWQIELTRFTAPLAAITSIVLVFARSTRVSIANYFVRYYTNHLVVVGLGNKSWQFLRTCGEHRRIVVVERNPENQLINRARALGLRVLVADVFEDGLLARVNLRQAAELVAFTGDDGTNVELAIKARSRVRVATERDRHLQIHIHLNEIGLAHQLESYPKFFTDYSIAEMTFFSVYDLSARLLLRDYPPEIFADVANQPRVHLAIYGFQRLAEKLVIEAALMGQYANGARLQFSIFDADASARQLTFEAEYPYLAQICDYTFIQQAAIGPHIFAGPAGALLPTVTQHIICTDSDEQSLNIALMLRGALLEKRASNAPILVRMQGSSGLAQLLESNTGDQEIPDGLYPFGMLDQVLHADNILTNQLDRLARAIHNMYLDEHGLKAEQSPAKPGRGLHGALQNWNDLPQRERKQNLLKADHWPIRMRAVRCVPVSTPLATPTFTDEETVLQARMEHKRYVNSKHFDGWQFGEKRIEAAKINPFLLPWEAMAADQQALELQEAIKLPEYFARGGAVFTQRKYVLGVTGHRLSHSAMAEADVAVRLKACLLDIRARYPSRQFVILSSLAEGADRLLAKLAMELLGATLQVPLPLPYDLYVADFTDEASVEEFKTLVGKAEVYYELPMRFGNIRELAFGADLTSNDARNRQYALAGAYIAQRSDQLIAIYDGQPEAGIGGTGQIVRWYNSREVDPEFRYEHHYFLAPEPNQALVIDAQR
jgi:voltage-gated potassium channel Kch